MQLKVENEEEGFVIRVLSERSCQGLLLFILEAFEEMGLDVVEARVTCEDTFCLEAIAAKVILIIMGNQLRSFINSKNG